MSSFQGFTLEVDLYTLGHLKCHKYRNVLISGVNLHIIMKCLVYRANLFRVGSIIFYL